MSPKAPFGAFVFHITICKPKENVIGSDSRSHIALDFAPVWAHRESRIPFSSIQNHDNTEQARIYPAKLKHIVPRRQSAIIAGLNKCKILTGTNASNGSRTRGYVFPFVHLLWLACICVRCRPTTQDAAGRRVHEHSPAAAWCSSLKWVRAGVDIKQDQQRLRFRHPFGFDWF